MKKSRHSNYQNISKKKIQEKEFIDHDELRFNWIKKLILNQNKIKKLTDIGSNLGYFCLKFNKTFGFNSTGYEYEKATFNKANKLKKNIKNVKYINKGLNIDNLKNLNKTDLIVHLNVLHHAGHMYDKKLISNEKDWVKYSIKYLKILSKKSNFLFFQTGNVNFNKNCFKSEDTFKILPKILKVSGWKIIKIGNIDLKNNKKYYKVYKPKDLKKIPTITCNRDKKTNKVFYKIDNKILFKYKSGFLQRPLFWCVTNN